MTLMQIGLDDKYRLDTKRIYLSGIQALVRLPMLQRERDRAQNLNTAGFISGYRGSPLGMYDNALWRAKSFLQSHDIAFVPGLNEDLAATAVWGSQQVGTVSGRQGRWRVRHLVWQGTRGRPFRSTRSSMPIRPAPRGTAAYWRWPATIMAANPQRLRIRANRYSPPR